jgi:hypothetical protein
MAQASANDSRWFNPPSLPPRKAPANLPKLAMRMRIAASNRRSGFFRTVRSALKPDKPKKTGMNRAAIRPRSC